MIRLTKNKKRKNPLKYIASRSINNINYEILNQPDYDEL